MLDTCREKKKKNRKRATVPKHGRGLVSRPHLRVCLDRTYFAETKNWKYYSIIIFKCVNSAVGPIFNKKIDKKWNLWVHEQYIDALFTENWSKVPATVHVPYMNSNRLWGKTREKKGGGNAETQRSIQTLPKGVEEVIRLFGKCACGNELSFYYYLKLFLNLKVQMGSPRHDWVVCSVR